MAISCLTASYFSSNPVAATTLLPLSYRQDPSRVSHVLAMQLAHEAARDSQKLAQGGTRSSAKLNFFLKPSTPRRSLPVPTLCPFAALCRNSIPASSSLSYRCKKERNRYPHNPFTLHAQTASRQSFPCLRNPLLLTSLLIRLTYDCCPAVRRFIKSCFRAS